MPIIGLVNSPDAPGQLSNTELSVCLLAIATILRVEEERLPRILVLHVSESVATEFGVTAPGVIRHNRCGAGEPLQYYEVWVIGTPDLSEYAAGFTGVLEDWFSLSISDKERRMAAEMAAWAACANLGADAVLQ